MEQVLTNIIFQIQAVSVVIDSFSPNKVLFIDEIGASYPSNTVFDSFINNSLFPFFKDYYNNIDFEQIVKEKQELKKNRSSFIKKIRSKSPSELLKNVKQKIIRLSLQENSIIISNGIRCLHTFVNVAKKNKSSLFILKDLFDMNNNETRSCTIYNRKEIFFDNISLKPFFDKIIPIIENKFYNLKSFYQKQIKLIIENKPTLYITVNIASSTELVKLWAFKKSNIRTVWSSEGIGMPDEKIMMVYNAVFHPEVDIERWTTSQFFSNTFAKNTKPVKVTGYLEGNINKEILKTKVKKQIVFALSIASFFVKRAIVGEDMFEILQSVSDVSDVVLGFPEYELIIKLHPGDSTNMPLCKNAIRNNSRVKIIADGNLNQIINQSELVIIYDTSVGLESLVKKKNVICYNYTNRPSYITAIYDYVNHDPEKGAALVISHTKKDLKKAIKKLLPYGNNTKPSPGLEYVLENAREDYDVEKVVKQILNESC